MHMLDILFQTNSVCQKKKKKKVKAHFMVLHKKRFNKSKKASPHCWNSSFKSYEYGVTIALCMTVGGLSQWSFTPLQETCQLETNHITSPPSAISPPPMKAISGRSSASLSYLDGSGTIKWRNSSNGLQTVVVIHRFHH